VRPRRAGREPNGKTYVVSGPTKVIAASAVPELIILVRGLFVVAVER
jgi:hypothetical protein